MTTIGPSVSVFRANDTKPRMWVTVFELFSSRPFNGSVISTDQALSLNLKKKIKIFFKPSGEVRFYSYDSKVDFSNSIYLHLFFVISILLLLISVVCSCCNFTVKGVTCFVLTIVGSHLLAYKKKI